MKVTSSSVTQQSGKKTTALQKGYFHASEIGMKVTFNSLGKAELPIGEHN